MKASFKLIAQRNSQAHSYEPRFARLLFSPQYRYSPDYYYMWRGEFYVCTHMENCGRVVSGIVRCR
jgi:hypothetical protein